MRFRLTRKLVIGAIVAAAVGAAGGAYAATHGSAAAPRQPFLEDAANRLGVTPQRLKGAALDQLSAAVAAGQLTRGQANAIKQRIESLHWPPTWGPLIGGPPIGARPPGVPPPGVPPPWAPPAGVPPLRGPHGLSAPGHHRVLDAAATYLGLSDVALRRQLASGKSLAQIAKAQGRSVTGLEASLTAALKARLARAVAAKALTSAQAAQIVKEFTARLPDLVARRWTRPLRPWGPHPGWNHP